MDGQDLKRRRQGKMPWGYGITKSRNKGVNSECIHSVIIYGVLARKICSKYHEVLPLMKFPFQCDEIDNKKKTKYF